MTSSRRAVALGRAAVLWTAVLFIGAQAGLTWWLYGRPELVNPDYWVRLARIQARQRDAGGRPLAVMLGSSRPMSGLRTDLLVKEELGLPAVVCNFAHAHSGPLRELIALRRLLAAGIKPQYAIIEVWVPFLAQKGFYSEYDAIIKDHPDWPDLPVVARYYRERWEPFMRLCVQSLTPAVHYRSEVLYAVAPWLLSRAAVMNYEWQVGRADTADAWGTMPIAEGRLGPKELAGSIEKGRAVTEPVLADLHLHPISERAFHEVLTECTTRGIRPMLVLMPEHSAMRSWYSPASRARVEEMVERLSQAYGAPAVDARLWLADEGFADYCHYDLQGASELTRRLAVEALRPWMTGAPLPEHVLLRGRGTGGDPTRQAGQ